MIDAVGEGTVRAVIDVVLTADGKPNGNTGRTTVMRFVLATRS
jgi:hypothetical protein